MKAIDLHMFDAKERNYLDKSFQTEELPRRMVNIYFNTCLLLAVSVALWWIEVRWALAALLLAVAAIAVVEKSRYVRDALTYRAVVRRLVHRIEHLEGVPPSIQRKQWEQSPG